MMKTSEGTNAGLGPVSGLWKSMKGSVRKGITAGRVRSRLSKARSLSLSRWSLGQNACYMN